MRPSPRLIFSSLLQHPLIPDKGLLGGVWAAPLHWPGQVSRPSLGDLLARAHMKALHRFVTQTLTCLAALLPSSTTQAGQGHCDCSRPRWAAAAPSNRRALGPSKLTLAMVGTVFSVAKFRPQVMHGSLSHQLVGSISSFQFVFKKNF